MTNQISMNKKYKTGEGLSVRLLCVDGPVSDRDLERRPVIGIVDEKDLMRWCANGRLYLEFTTEYDLVEDVT